MAMVVEGVPSRIHADDVRAVIEDACEALNRAIQRENAEEDQWETADITRLSFHGDEATAYGVPFMSSTPDGMWGNVLVRDSDSRDFHTSVKTAIAWCERLGIDPMNTTRIEIRGGHVQVVAFHREDGHRMLRQDEVAYLKHTIDIPIYQENSRG